MIVREVRLDEKHTYNALVDHPIQSWEWGGFKEKTGVKVVRLGVFEKKQMKSAYQLSFHPIPKVPYSVGYFPKGPKPDQKMMEAILKPAFQNQAIFIKLEPNVLKEKGELRFGKLKSKFNLQPGRSVFAPHTFIIDLTQDEDELLSQMKSKTRYNVRLAKRRGVEVTENNSQEAFETYLKLTFETANRQEFYVHNQDYHRKMWETLHPAGIARLLTATWKDKILVAWIVFVFNEVIYYPYGASSGEHRNLMASNLMMWEAMRFGKKLGCKSFDLWGSLGPEPDKDDPWYGFHRFKEGYGGELVEFVDSHDLIISPQLYQLYNLADRLRWKFLRWKSQITWLN